MKVVFIDMIKTRK